LLWVAGRPLCSIVASLPSLHSRAQELHLRTRCYTLSEARLLAAAPLPRLARLVVFDEGITDHAGLLQLSAAPWAPQLRSLELNCSNIPLPVTAPDMQPQNLVFQGLQALTIHHSTRADAASFVAAELPRLRSLTVGLAAEGGVTALFAGPPSWASSLQALDLSHNVQLPGSWAGAALARAPLHALRSLRLRAYGGPTFSASLADDDTIQSLVRAPWLSGLTELSFSGQALLGRAPAAWAELAAAPLPSLRRLELRWCAGTGFGAAAAAALAAAPWLRCLELLDVTGASEEALGALRASAAFRELQHRRAALF
jgi:hypothetical protein